MKTYCLIFAMLISLLTQSQDQSFEVSTVPSNWNAATGNLAISTLHYKHNKKCLQWNWNANDVLTISNLQDHGLIPSEVLGYFENMFRMWVYNTNALPNQKLEIAFYDNTGSKQFYYDFYVNFTGWRAASASYKHEMYGNKTSTNITTLKIKAPHTGSGIFFFDYIDYTMGRNTYRSPDYQLPYLQADNGQHWSDMMYFQSLPKTINVSTPTPQEINDLIQVKNAYQAAILGNPPGTTAVNNAVNAYNHQKIKYENGIVTGKPLFGTDFSDANSIAVVDDFIYTLARDYKHKNNANSLTYYVNTIRYLLDQGYADGSCLETLHHVGYRCRNVIKSVHLMKEELIAANLWTPAQKMAEWLTAIDIIWHPTAHHSNIDDGLTRSVTLLGACLNKDSDAEKVKYLKGLQQYFHNWLSLYAKEGEGLKVDYTAFHHNVYYPQYAFGAYKNVAEALHLLSGSMYAVSDEKRTVFKKILQVARVNMNQNTFPNGLSGRSPMNPISITTAYKNLGIYHPVDTDLIGVYNYITGGDNTTNQHAIETPPNGFWQINFANLGTYRQDDWLAGIKGFNKYFWGTEIYGLDNRYGRYQSYGSVEIIYKDGQEASGTHKNGWNWNLTPGATTIVLPFDNLKASKSRQDEKTDSNFAAALRFGKKTEYYIEEKLEGNYGMFGMDFTQKAITTSHNPSFTFKKSVFAFDGKLICLGSNIHNNDGTHKTVTTLFQNQLNSKNDAIVVNNNSITSFPYQTTLNNTNSHWLLDAYGTGYYVKNNQQINIDRQNQTSPNENGKGATTTGNFASAYIDHGTNPNNQGYEYVIVPKTNPLEMIDLNTKMQHANTAIYNVVQKNETAHIVHYNNMYGYALFKAGNYGIATPLQSNSEPCLVMTEHVGSHLNMSVVSPHLNFDGNNGSQPVTISLILNGNWELKNSNSENTTFTNQNTTTTIHLSCKDGLPVDIELVETTTASIPKETEKDESLVKVYPNPSDDFINIDLNSTLKAKEIAVVNILGKTMYRQKDTTPIAVHFLNTGIYFLIVRTQSGKTFKRKIQIY